MHAGADSTGLVTATHRPARARRRARPRRPVRGPELIRSRPDGDGARRAPVESVLDSLRMRRRADHGASGAHGRGGRAGTRAQPSLRTRPGSVNETRAPPLGRSSAQMRPPCASTMPAGDREPQPGAARGASRVAAPEAVEHPAGAPPRRAPRPCPRRDLHLRLDLLDADRDGAVGRRVAQGVREQVEAARARPSRARSARCTSLGDRCGEVDASPARVRLDAAQARLDDRLEQRVAELEGQRAGVDPRELEEVVHERREEAHLLPEDGDGRVAARRGRPRAPRASPACWRAGCGGRGSPTRRARGARRRAARGSPPSR